VTGGQSDDELLREVTELTDTKAERAALAKATEKARDTGADQQGKK
jgi:hypothetical protein